MKVGATPAAGVARRHGAPPLEWLRRRHPRECPDAPPCTRPPAATSAPAASPPPRPWWRPRKTVRVPWYYQPPAKPPVTECSTEAAENWR